MLIVSRDHLQQLSGSYLCCLLQAIDECQTQHDAAGTWMTARRPAMPMAMMRPVAADIEILKPGRRLIG